MEQQQPLAPKKSRWKNITPEQRSEMMRRAAAMRKNPGRKKGSKTRPLEERLAHPRVRAKYIPKPKDPEAIRVRAARARAFVKNPGGKGKPRDGTKFFHRSDGRTVVCVIPASKSIFLKCAEHEGITLVKFMHRFAIALTRHPKYRHLFPDPESPSEAATATPGAADGGTGNAADNAPDGKSEA